MENEMNQIEAEEIARSVPIDFWLELAARLSERPASYVRKPFQPDPISEEQLAEIWPPIATDECLEEIFRYMNLEDIADAIDRREEITDEEMEFINRLAYQEKDLLARCCLITYHENYTHPETDFSQL